jgi:transcriptional regulator with XRE-family HTH domain
METLSLMQLGIYFRNRRLFLKMTVAEVAHAAKVSTRTYIKVENEAEGVKVTTLQQIASVLGFELETKIFFTLIEKAL